jgi:hypothetical protein
MYSPPPTSLPTAGVALMLALAALLGACDRAAEARADDREETSRPGPYGAGTGATPPAAQGRPRDGGVSKRDAGTTTSGAGMSDGGAYVPGTGVASERHMRDGGTTAPNGRDK